MSSLKKATAFTKKLRNINDSNKDAIIKEISQVKLENYKSEVITGLGENISHQNPTSDIDACVEVYLAMKNKLQGDFHLKTAEMFKKILTTADDKERIIKIKNVLFFTTKLHTAQFFVYKVADDVDMFDSIMGGGTVQLSKKALKFDSAKFAKDVFKYITEKDEHFNNTAIVLEFIDHFPNFKAEYNDLLLSYFESLSKFMVKLNAALIKAEKFSREYLFNRGHDVPDEQKKKHDQMSHKFDLLMSQITSLSAALHQTVPTFTKLENEMIKPGSITFAQNLDLIQSSTELWDEVDDPNFYKIIEDLRNHVPKLFADGTKEEEQELESDSPEELDAAILLNEEDETEVEQPVPHTPLAIYLDNLVNVSSQDQSDKYAIHFCHFNSKTSRNKLVLHMIQLSRRNLHLIPYMVRIIKTLGKYFPDIISALLGVLDTSFKYFLVNKPPSGASISSGVAPRYAIILFISESIKFQILDPPMFIYYLQSLIDGMSIGKLNILTTIKLLDSCGRFYIKLTDLQGNEALKLKLDQVLQNMLKLSKNMETQYNTELSNAYSNLYSTHLLNKIDIWVETPMRAFIMHYLMILTDDNKQQVLVTLLKLPWSNTDTQSFIIPLLSNPLIVPYASIAQLAWLNYKLSSYYPLIVLRVIDTVSATIKHDFITNIYTNNQRRIAMMRLVGEFYTMGLVGMEFILDILMYTLIFGWHGIPGLTTKTVYNAYDAPHDYFRIRLFGTLLSTCSHLLPRSHQTKTVISLFYVYLTAKQGLCPLPLDVGHFIKDCFNKAGYVMKNRMGYEEAFAQYTQIVKSTTQQGEMTPEKEVEVEKDVEATEEIGDVREEVVESEDNEDNDSNSTSSSNSSMSLNIEAEMALMMAEASSQNKKHDRGMVKLKDVVVPHLGNVKQNETGQIGFNLLTRKKNNTRILYMDKESVFVKSVQAHKDVELEELKSLKSQTLKLERELA